MTKSIFEGTYVGGNGRNNTSYPAYEAPAFHTNQMETQQFLSNISTLGHLSFTLIHIFSIDWKWCLEQLNWEPLSEEAECENDFNGERIM